MTEQEQKNRALAAQLLEHYSRNNHTDLLAMVTHDCEFRIGVGKSQGIVPYHGVHRGHQQIGAYLQKRRQHSMRSNCILRPPGRAGASSGQAAHAHDQFLVDGDTVVGIGHLTDHFADGTHMHDTDFVLVFRVNEAEGKICFFQYFLDTASLMHAWQHHAP